MKAIGKSALLMAGMLFGTGAVLSAAAPAKPAEKAVVKKLPMPVLAVMSPVFSNGGKIADRYACGSGDISPAISWSGAPAATKSFALIVDDPDAPPGVWVHWVVYDIPAAVSRLPEEIPHIEALPDGTKQGMAGGVDTFTDVGYKGPCPPPGMPHHYLFKLYALNKKLNLPPKATKFQVQAAMQNNIVAQGELVGLYQR